MRAVILAAGSGQRLLERAENKPKCLLKFNNISLLERHIRILSSYGVKKIYIVVGYQAKMIANLLNSQTVQNCLITEILNPRFQESSMLSLWTTQVATETHEETLLMDADVLYDPNILARLIHSNHKNCLLLDRIFEADGEAVTVSVKENRIVSFGKQVPSNIQFDWQGESVGFFKLSVQGWQHLMQYAGQYCKDTPVQKPYEDAMAKLILSAPDTFGYEEVTGLAWTEIDFPADLDRAKSDILPKLGPLK